MRTLFRVGAIIFYKGKLVIEKMKKKGKEYYVLPGGGVEGDETIYDAVKREIQEELGVEIIKFRLVYIKELSLENGNRGAEFYFYVEEYKGIPKKGFDPEKTKESTLEAVDLIKIEDLKNYIFYPIELIEILKEDKERDFKEIKHLGLHSYP